MNNIYLPKSNKLISFPNPLDKPSFLKSINYNNIKKHPNKLSNEQILNINKNNINNYYDYLSEIVYSEEIYFGSKNISYDELLEYINLKSVYSQNKYKNFKYINHKYDNNIFFSSNFESGNLRMAIKHSDYEYDLILRPETNSPKTFHWFFFLVELNKPIKSKQYIIKFNIINISRNTMLLDEKVRVLSYYNNYWARDTFNIFFYENNIPNLYDYEENLITEEIEYYNNYESYFYTLSFSFDFSKIDTNEKYVFFSYSFPYTYTNLVNFVRNNKGYINPKLIPNETSNINRYIITKEKIKKDEILLIIPDEILISKLHKSINSICIEAYGLIEEYEYECVVYFMTIDKYNSSSIFKPYYNYLPKINISDFVLSFNEEEKKLFKDIGITEGIITYEFFLDKALRPVEERLKKFAKKNNIKYEEILEEFKNNFIMVGTRNFGRRESIFDVNTMVPYLDLINHSDKNNTDWNYDAVKKAIE